MFSLHGQILCWPYTTEGTALSFNHASKIKGEHHIGSVPWKRQLYESNNRLVLQLGEKKAFLSRAPQ